MNFSRIFRIFCLKHGQAITLCQEDGTQIGGGWGFVQPITTENKNYLWQAQSELGSYDGSQFRLLGEANLLNHSPGDGFILCQGRKFDIRALQPIYLGNQLAYWWGILTLRDEEDDCYEAQ